MYLNFCLENRTYIKCPYHKRMNPNKNIRSGRKLLEMTKDDGIDSNDGFILIDVGFNSSWCHNVIETVSLCWSIFKYYMFFLPFRRILLLQLLWIYVFLPANSEHSLDSQSLGLILTFILFVFEEPSRFLYIYKQMTRATWVSFVSGLS